MASLKRWLPTLLATLLTMWLLYVGKDYPCLTGAGLALADFEAFVLSVLIALPCLVWAIRRLWLRSKSSEQVPREARWITFLAVLTIVDVMLYALVAIPVIFSFAQHPMQFMCR